MAVSMLKVTQARPNQLLGNSDRDTKVALAVWCLPRSTRPTGEAGQICGQQTQSSVVGITLLPSSRLDVVKLIQVTKLTL